jgi:hypothetical protein
VYSESGSTEAACHAFIGALNDRPQIEHTAPAERIAIWALASFAFLIRVPLAFGSAAGLTARYGDDAFYILSVARNFASGRGITIDGTHLTNGFQPLIAALYSLAFWAGGDSWTAVRITVLMNAAITFATVIAVASVARKLWNPVADKFWQRPSVIAAFLWACSISIFHQTTTGLETALYSLTLLLVLGEYLRSDTSPWRLGLLLGIAVLARIDAAILVAILVGYDLWIRNIRRAIIEGALAFIVSLPWWLFNLLNFGSLMPTSGKAEVSWPTTLTEQLYRLIQTLNDIAIVMIYTPHDSSFAIRIVTMVVIAAAIALLFFRMSVLRHLKNSKLRALLPFWLFGFILIIYYTFYFRAPHFIIRYLQPLRIIALLSWSVVLGEILMRNNLSPKNRVPKLAIAICLLISLGFGVNRYFAFYHKPNGSEFYDVGIWASAHPHDRIGMLQSGIAGFVAPNVVNLDGKVNAAALDAHERGELGRYIKAEGFTYLADWKPFVEDIAQLCRQDELFFDSVGMVQRVQIMKRREP